MNNKGFTLVELLATVLILSIITGIATISYTSYLKKTKSKAEEIFKENVSNYIDAFISANTSKLTDEELVGNNVYSQKYNNHSITFQDIINDNIIIPPYPVRKYFNIKIYLIHFKILILVSSIKSIISSKLVISLFK